MNSLQKSSVRRGIVFFTPVWIALTLAILVAPVAHSQTYCVRVGASGLNDDADWIIASLRSHRLSSVVRRTTLRTENTGGYAFVDAACGTSFITIKKAIDPDHGTSMGWRNAYGDGEALFASWYVKGDYYLTDGQPGGEPNN